MRIIKFPLFCALASLLLMASLTVSFDSFSADGAVASTEIFPGLEEVVPRANAVAAQVAEAEAQVQQAEQLEDVYVELDKLAESLKQLEELYSNWDEVNDWQLTRLLGAQGSYTDLSEQQAKPLDIIYSQLEKLASQRSHWEEQKNYWQEWQTYFKQNDIRDLDVVFSATRSAINDLLNKIDNAAGILVKAQQKYAPGVLAGRLTQIDNTLDNVRRNSFRRNTFSLYEADYYHQYNEKLFTDFKRDLAASSTLPDNFFTRYAEINALNILCVVAITLLLVYRKRRQKALNEEWIFLYNRPLSSALFITLIPVNIAGDFYANAPPLWKFLVALAITIAAVRLLNGIYEQRFARNFVRVIAILFIVNVALQVYGIPAPLLQLIQTVLSAVAVPFCLWQARKHRQNLYQKHLVALYVICGVSLLSFFAALLGFATLSKNLIDGTLSSFILIILTQMSLRLIKGGVQAFMGLDWVKNRQFMKKLGIEVATKKLKNLLRIIVLVNAGIYFLVVWKLFATLEEARTYLLDLDYSFGGFSFSIEMVLMIVIVLYLTNLFSWVIQAFLDTQVMTPKSMDIGVKESLKRLTHYGLFSIGFLTAVSMAGLDLQKFSIIAGALGVGIGFGLQNVVSNFVSGLILLFERPVKVGDTINIGEDWGTITKIGLRSTVFETFDRSEIIVPNADLVSQKVTNWTFSSKMVRVQLPVGVAYGSPLDAVLKILIRASLEHKEVLSYPEPSAVFVGFGNSSIDFNLRFWVYSIDDRLRIQTDVAVIIDRLFREEGITIPFPQQDLHLRSVEEGLQPLFGKKPKENNSEEKAEDEGTPL